MRGFGQIAELCAIARPRRRRDHERRPRPPRARRRSLDGVARAKAELVAALPPGGTAVVPESAFRSRPRRHRGRAASATTSTLESFEPPALRTSLRRRRARLHVAPPPRARTRSTALARAATRSASRVAGASCDVEFSRWRGEELAAPRRRPADQRRLQREPDLDARRARAPRRARRATRRRVAVLGDMAELGAGAPRLPRGGRRAPRPSSASTCCSRSARSRAATSTARPGSPVALGAPTPRRRRRCDELVAARRLRARQGLARGRPRARRRGARGGDALEPRPHRGGRRAARSRSSPARSSSPSCAARSSASTSARRARSATSSSRARRRWAAC